VEMKKMLVVEGEEHDLLHDHLLLAANALKDEKKKLSLLFFL
jgi:hypothetical protein